MTQNNGLTKTGRQRRRRTDNPTHRLCEIAITLAVIEGIFGWGKQHGALRKTKHRGIRRVAADFLLNIIAYNLVRIPKLVPA